MTGKNIWSRITLENLVDAIASLGDRIEELGTETWRLNAETKSSSSVWGEVINKLQLNHSEATRQSLYKIWHSNRHKIVELTKQKVSVVGRNKSDGNDGGINRIEDSSVPERNNINLMPDPSLPLPERPKTRANQKENAGINNTQSSVIKEISFVLTANEWKNVFSCTHQKLKEGWTDIFYRKLTSSGVQCSVSFSKSYIKKGKRKHACQFFSCCATCTINICYRRYRIILRQQPDLNSTALFLVQIFGEENHNINIEISARQLRGENRFLVGKELYYFFSKVILI
jgi:hypothetical protein